MRAASNYKWIGRADRLKDVLVRGQKSTWAVALNEISDKLKRSMAGSVAIIASARQTNEELWLIAKLKTKLGAISDSIPRTGPLRQAARQRGQESEHERRAPHGDLLHRDGH